ncbi:MAG: pilus assembly protein CpaB [Solirubrobacteraceae bacterium]|nr:pilus assembly protein CpaB [Solirubrobacteraceae bacterium]
MTRRRRGLLLLGLAVVLGVLAASDVSRREAAIGRALAPLVDVVVATRDLPAGRPLRGRDLAVRAVPARWAPVGAAASVGEVAGATPSAELPRGAYVTGMDLALPDAPGGAPVRRGERAVEVVAAGSPALIAPGARVDVLVTREDAGTRLALQDVEVLAAGPALDGDGAAAPGTRVAATLRTTVRQAVYLTAAQSFAREIRLLPRAAGDDRIVRQLEAR